MTGPMELLRQARRIALKQAIEGPPQARLHYAFDRATAPTLTTLALYGTVVADYKAIARRAFIVFEHLEHAARRRAA